VTGFCGGFWKARIPDAEIERLKRETLLHHQRADRAGLRETGGRREGEHRRSGRRQAGAVFSTLANLARWLEQVGAGALVLFNRLYQPDFDLEDLEIVPGLKLST